MGRRTVLVSPSMQMASLQPAWASALALGVLVGCGTTEGPLVVRNHSGGSGADAGTPLTPPAVDVSWQVQLSGDFDSTVDVALYYIDLDGITDAERVSLTGAGRHLACYLSSGTYEPWRADASAFPASVIGNALLDYPNERWLDIRSSDVTALMTARLDQYESDGCNSVVVANVTTTENTGFGITAANQSDYLIWLSSEIHKRGFLAGLATGEDRLAKMEPIFDWAYAQGCWVDNRCSDYSPFVTTKKPVLAVEFGDASTAPSLCSGVAGSGINLLVKPADLSAGRVACLP